MPRLPHSVSYSLQQSRTEPAVPWISEPGRSALLIHDLQQHFLKPFQPDAEPYLSLINNIQRIAQRARELGIPVFYTAQPADQPAEDRALLTDFWGPGLTGDSEGSQILPELEPQDSDHVLTKWRYSAFKRTELLDLLNKAGRDQLIITGIYAHIGCQVTAVEAFMQDVQPFMVADAVADFSQEEHQGALEWVASRAGVVLDTEQLLSGWVDSGAEVSADGVLPRLKAELAPLLYLEPDELNEDDDLMVLGLDSIRMMELVTRLREAGIQTSFEKLASAGTLGELAESL